MGKKAQPRIPLFVQSLVETGVEHITRALAVDADIARQVMNGVAESICWQHARTLVYVPSYRGPQLAKRDAAIQDAYAQDGPNGARKFTCLRVAQLSEEHELTTQQIYAIVRNKAGPAAPAVPAVPADAVARAAPAAHVACSATAG